MSKAFGPVGIKIKAGKQKENAENQDLKKLNRMFGGIMDDPSAIVGKLASKLKASSGINANFIHCNEPDPPPKEFIHSSVPGVDKLLGGGIPVGKIGEVFGPESSGKSTLCMHFSRDFQEAGGIVVSIDSEHSWDEARFLQLGGKSDRLIYAESDTIQEMFSIITSVVESQLKQTEKTQAPCLIIVDTVAAAPLAEEMSALLEGRQYYDMGGKAKYLSAQLRQLPRKLGQARTSIIFVNQVRENFKAITPYQEQYVVPGGKAIPFYATWRLFIKKVSELKDRDTVIGQKIRIKTKKCKTAPPSQQVQIDLIYSTGEFDEAVGLLEELKSAKCLRKTKNGYNVKSDELLALGFEEKYEDEDVLKKKILEQREGVFNILNPAVSSQPEDTDDTAEESEKD